jgi:hypothetical protein
MPFGMTYQIVQRRIKHGNDGKVVTELMESPDQFVYSQITEGATCKTEERQHERLSCYAFALEHRAVDCRKPYMLCFGTGCKAHAVAYVGVIEATWR